MTSLPLSDAHRKMLRDESAIAEWAIEQRQYQTTDNAQRFGFGPQQPQSGLLLPIWGVDGTIVGYQLRPDHPRTINGRICKYENLGGWKARIDVPPSVLPILGDPTKPIWLTEGIKKTDSLISHGVPTIGLVGVWAWIGRNEHGGKVEISDWRAIALNGRTVILCFDNDLWVKPKVRQALDELAAMLSRRGARVKYALIDGGRSDVAA